MSIRVALRKTSLVDYPGKVAATLFFRGCGLCCPWCHNPQLVRPAVEAGEDDSIPLEEAIAIIRKRRRVLGGAVLTGGEPLLQPEIGVIIAVLKEMGYSVKLDTNGMHPDRLESILADVKTRPDYVAMDLKLAPTRYAGIVGGGTDAGAARAVELSAQALASSGVEREFRSLALPNGFFSNGDVRALAPLVGGAPWYFAPFRPGNCLDGRWNAYEMSRKEEVQALAAEAVRLGADGKIRGIL
jgi:pyruvate formate lyase activating enzyme